MQVRAQIAMVMNLDKCIGCHTCSVTCKNVWTNRRGTEYVWFNDVETKPGIGYPKRWRIGALEGRLGAPGRQAPAQGGRASPQARDAVLQPRAAHARRLLRAVDRTTTRRSRRQGRRSTNRSRARVAGDGASARPAVGAELGGRPRGRSRPGPARPQPARRRRGARAARVREGVHVLPPSDLRALPQPLVRRVVPLGCDVQARGGRHRARRPGAVPLVADVRERLPVQEGLLQLVDRQGREVHPLLPADRSDDLLGDLCRQDPLPRRRLYDADRVQEAASVPDEKDLLPAQLSLFLDPNDSRVREQARRDGIAEDWLDAARRSPVYRSRSSTGSRCRSTPSTGRCRWSGTCRRSRR